MRIIFVRHGHPNYREDCLTELGHLHAKAVAERLCGEHIEKIYSSSCGRAYETAEYIAKRQGISSIEAWDFLREITWGCDTEELYQNGHPWHTANKMVLDGQSLMHETWGDEAPFVKNKCVQNVNMIGEEFDVFLSSIGFVREGEFYRVKEPKYQTIAVVSHGGASNAVLARMFNLPFPFLCTAICPNYTAVTVVLMKEQSGDLIAPQFELVNDARHIEGLETESYFGR